MDQLQTRLDALEQRTQTVERRLRWWRGLPCGLLALAVLTWALPAGLADDTKHDNKKDLEQRVAALEAKLKYLNTRIDSSGRPLMEVKGANLRLVNGLGRTDCGTEEEPIPDCPNGLRNLIVGYNEPREEDLFGPNVRTGSHNVVVGRQHNFSRVGGLVVGDLNTISGDFAAVSGGFQNTASGIGASVSGGQVNTASGDGASVSGGFNNTASGFAAAVSGGEFNTASGDAFTAVSGGSLNTATGTASVVSGGFNNTAEGDFSAVSGGGSDPDQGGADGQGNTASGDRSVVSGGRNRTAAGEFDWVAGSLVEDD